MGKKSQRIGVTGAAGFIGSHLCEKLLQKDYKVIAIDNLSKGNEENINHLFSNKGFQFFKSDITNPKTAKKYFGKVDAVIHLAAGKIPRYGNRFETLITNSDGTRSVLEVLKNNKAKFILASTSDVYGKNDELPFKEDSDLVIGPPDVARWSYAVSKIFDEHLCYAYWEKYEVPFVILRFFGAYGPKQHRSWWGGPQSLFIDKLLSHGNIEIHGSGKQTRSFVFIDDLVDAVIRSLRTKKAINQVINIGSKSEISIIDFAKLIADEIGTNLRIKKIAYKSFTGKKYEDVKRRVPDISKAAKLLNWIPKTTLKNGIKKTVSWYKANLTIN